MMSQTETTRGAELAALEAQLPAGWKLSTGGEALVCEALPAVHGFSTRLGGISSGPYASLNLGGNAGDDPAAVQINRRRFLEAAGLASAWVSVHQVHGADVVTVDEGGPGADARGDAVITSRVALPVGVYVADCVPLLLADRHGRAVAAVHSGWRGTARDVAGAAVRALAELGVAPADVVAAIGPSARKCCYEVGAEVVEAFDDASPPARGDDREGWLGQGPNGLHVDPAVLIRRQLREAGVLPESIHDSGLCTICNPGLFFSYRREGKASGRMAAVIQAGGISG